MAGSSAAASPCASCKLLRRRCSRECVFAPYFPAEEPQRFAMVHRVFGASNVSKMLLDLPAPHRADAVSSLVYEAAARLRDPVYGAAGAVSALQHQVSHLQAQLALAQAQVLCAARHPPPPTPPLPAASQQQLQLQQMDIDDLVVPNGLMMNTLSNAAAAHHQLMLQEAVCLKKESPLWA